MKPSVGDAPRKCWEQTARKGSTVVEESVLCISLMGKLRSSSVSLLSMPKSTLVWSLRSAIPVPQSEHGTGNPDCISESDGEVVSLLSLSVSPSSLLWLSLGVFPQVLLLRSSFISTLVLRLISLVILSLLVL